MHCKRCGFPLPSTGYLCTNCGSVMDTEQIKKQKEQMKMNPKPKQEQMLSMRFGKKELFQKREETNKNYSIFFLLFFLFVLL